MEMKMKIRLAMIMFAMGLVLSGWASSAKAEDAYPAFEYSFYDDLVDWNTPAYINDTVCHTALPYDPFLTDNATPNGIYPPGYPTREAWTDAGWTRDLWVTNYLDYADAHGMKVILSCKEFVSMINANPNNPETTWEDFEIYVSTFNDHPALKGWYLADEPTDDSFLASCTIGYNYIKSLPNSKPVYMSFEYQSLALNTAINYADTYDIMMFDHYAIVKNEVEFSRFDTTNPAWPGWKEYCTTAMAQAVSAGNKPFINILQAQGRNTDASNYRLPTLPEERFMIFWSVLKGGAGVSFWAMDQLINNCNAYSTDLYKLDGVAWLTDVGKPICQELEKLQYALGRVSASGAVSAPVPVANGVT
ncbi:MAG: hypothetical protein NT118_04780, partial [Lentisphaerae bacterium]|nr:hypothetical protein [Lentisphaerota bacterium]